MVGLVRTARPLQWSKNLLVLVAPAAAGVLDRPGDVARALACVAVFCAAASSVYLVNDVRDVAADRLHPDKCRRPVASGQVSVTAALLAGVAVGAGSLVGAWAVAGWNLFGVVALYIALSAAYSLWIKQMPVVELAAVASGFVLRAVAGGAATNVPLSRWFLVVATFGALFLVTGKRAAEHATLGESRAGHRRVLEDYTPRFLHAVLVVTASVTVTGYCLWAFGHDGLLAIGQYPVFIELTTVPVTVGLIYALWLFDAGKGGAPEQLVLHDRLLQVLGASWVALMAIGIYA